MRRVVGGSCCVEGTSRRIRAQGSRRDYLGGHEWRPEYGGDADAEKKTRLAKTRLADDCRLSSQLRRRFTSWAASGDGRRYGKQQGKFWAGRRVMGMR